MEQEIFTLADELAELKDRKKALNDELKDVNDRIEEVEEQLASKMVEEEIQSFQRSGRTFYVTTKVFANAVPERRTELFVWLKENGFGDMVQETVNSQTLVAWVREQLADSDQLPEGLDELINVYEKTTVGVRKAK